MISKNVFDACETLMSKNIGNAKSIKINFPQFLSSISKDKKNIGSQVTLIVPINDQLKIEKISTELDQSFKDFCFNYFKRNSFYVE